MRAIVAVALLLFSVIPEQRAFGCSQVFIRSERPPRPDILLVSATTDSVRDVPYYRSLGGIRTTRESPYDKEISVYGQRFDLNDAQGPHNDKLKSFRQIVIIWWGINPGCGREAPFQTMRVRTGEVFVLSQPRPAERWIGGLPTFDVDIADWVFVPHEANAADSRHSSMTASEYLKYFLSLPVVAGPPGQTVLLPQAGAPTGAAS